ncbi:hypothetical protein H9L39_14387 [Fusarium oxysporum f. sp. albedinis]|nr:hypothetical protein H9L39_14387 [Fusarium oxysporum f. sp. albedinis]
MSSLQSYRDLTGGCCVLAHYCKHTFVHSAVVPTQMDREVESAEGLGYANLGQRQARLHSVIVVYRSRSFENVE